MLADHKYKTVGRTCALILFPFLAFSGADQAYSAQVEEQPKQPTRVFDCKKDVAWLKLLQVEQGGKFPTGTIYVKPGLEKQESPENGNSWENHTSLKKALKKPLLNP